MMPHIGLPELAVVLVLALVIFGPGKLPEVGKAIGKSIKEFKSASKEVKEQSEKILEEK